MMIVLEREEEEMYLQFHMWQCFNYNYLKQNQATENVLLGSMNCPE